MTVAPPEPPTVATEQPPPTRWRALQAWLAHPVAPYYLMIGAAAMLVGLGLMMVLSASGVLALRESGDSYAIVKRQLIFVAAGLPVAYLVSRTPISVIRRTAWPLLLGSIVLLLLTYVPGLGVVVNGSRNWLDFGGPFNLQPSELGKLALVVWGAHVLASKGDRIRDLRQLMVPLVLGATVVIALTLGQKDLGTAIILGAILMGLLWVAGVPSWLLGAGAAVSGLIGAVFVAMEPYRQARLLSFLNPAADPLNTGYQAMASLYAFGSGGWWGVGLGASRQKWGRLPEAHTDFIYAVIGEELGMVGSLAVLALLLVLAYAGLRIAMAATDPFVRFAVAGVLTWMMVQAIVNIGAAINVLPITGVPLPLVSYGGSAMTIGLTALGVVLAGARADPAVRAALTVRRSRPPSTARR
jgi:cell division protein FtsW